MGAMKNAIIVTLIFTCVGTNWPTSGDSRLDTIRLHGSNDNLTLPPQHVCRSRLAVQDSKLVASKATWILLFPIAVICVQTGEIASLSALPNRVPSSSTLHSQHILLRL